MKRLVPVQVTSINAGWDYAYLLPHGVMVLRTALMAVMSMLDVTAHVQEI
jgi:hypothetical protein